jgi:hypothetical protein
VRLYTKTELVDLIRQVAAQGWHRSVKKTKNSRNDGAVGNTLEALLGLRENNLPIPNMQEWELKGQRHHTSSLVTLKHIEPSPRGAKIVSNILLPYYGWEHKQAGSKYPATEKSFRSTTKATEFTNRGFRLIMDREKGKLRFVFDPSQADKSDTKIRDWIKSIESKIGLQGINPEPYWGLDDLKYEIGAKIKNCFYVIADSKTENGHEFFKYVRLLILSRFSFDNFLKCIENGTVLVDFDARTGHNHGTKFRIRQNQWHTLYNSVEDIKLVSH